MTRILLLSPADLDLPDDVVTADVLDADTQVEHRRVIYPSCPPIGAHDWALADLAILAAGQNAEAEGFQAVCLADFGDYGAGALRSVLAVPVVTAGRTSMLYSLTLAERFSVLATDRDLTRAKKLVHDYGLDGRCEGVDLAGADMGNEASREVLILAGNARQLVKQAGSTVIDPVAVCLKIAESLIGLSLTHSRHAYPEPQVRKADLIKALSA
ncbi:hydantoin racemase [Rhizobiales bacterium RZME27]|uniref:Hydantoin racemase n=1 Tax=Endobacterium cereale TaxID=2663029 RepID=A0A6A8A688_9HYPH|nr:aspartate/glutamate racemase family protein [Endobacterium cereale]MEB2844564.1 aspartate/glutamate racemase family protein [Endobacterium cereale]MQY45120.1 hydantoin racemase [Endobacterium cereale]